MRATQGQLNRYAPEPIPSDVQELPRYIANELQKIQFALSQLADGQDDVVTVAPAKPREGMRRNADGTSWNPGSGAGLYIYRSGAWRLLG